MYLALPFILRFVEYTAEESFYKYSGASSQDEFSTLPLVMLILVLSLFNITPRKNVPLLIVEIGLYLIFLSTCIVYFSAYYTSSIQIVYDIEKCEPDAMCNEFNKSKNMSIVSNVSKHIARASLFFLMILIFQVFNIAKKSTSISDFIIKSITRIPSVTTTHLLPTLLIIMTILQTQKAFEHTKSSLLFMYAYAFLNFAVVINHLITIFFAVRG